MRPNFDPRRMKIDVENEVEKRRLLKIVLEPSWVDLGSSWVPSWGQNRAPMQGGARFFENRLFEENEASRGDLGRTWANLGAQGGQNGTKMGPKMAPKATPKTIKKKHRFWGDFGVHFFSECDVGTAVGGCRLASPSH